LCNAGPDRTKIAHTVERPLATLDYAPTFPIGPPIAFDFASKLAAHAPGGPQAKLDGIFFTGSGSESVATALKIAIAYQRA
ncbi:aspartate aminotransferase family protein, partial [Rhizobium ruizarguesonis]